MYSKLNALVRTFAGTRAMNKVQNKSNSHSFVFYKSNPGATGLTSVKYTFGEVYSAWILLGPQPGAQRR